MQNPLIDNLNKLDKTVLKEIVEVRYLDPKFKKALTTQKTDTWSKSW